MPEVALGLVRWHVTMHLTVQAVVMPQGILIAHHSSCEGDQLAAKRMVFVFVLNVVAAAEQAELAEFATDGSSVAPPPALVAQILHIVHLEALDGVEVSIKVHLLIGRIQAV